MMEKLVSLEPNAQRLTWSTSTGIFLAFSPYLGLQTPLGFVLAMLLKLNFGVIALMIWTINNPWVMIPLAGLEYIFGHWIIEKVLGIDLMPYNPMWMNWLNDKIRPITEYLGIEQLCLWYFLIGGTLIAIFASLITYPLVHKMSNKLIKKYSHHA